MKEYDEVYAAKVVARGAEWLDEHHPGWERRIDVGNLNMLQCGRCIIGQLLGPRAWGQLCASLGDIDIESLGFVQFHAHPDLDPCRAAWVGLIKERFASGLLSDER